MAFQLPSAASHCRGGYRVANPFRDNVAKLGNLVSLNAFVVKLTVSSTFFLSPSA